jgi:enterochelin esterase-like enzyme
VVLPGPIIDGQSSEVAFPIGGNATSNNIGSKVFERRREMKRAFCTLVALFAICASVVAQDIPCMPPGGYDQGGRFPAGALTDAYYRSPVTGADKTMIVYTPPGYNPGQKYAVVYGFHGAGADAWTIFADWCVNAGIVADNLIGEGTIKPLIIVAINYGDICWNCPDLYREMTEGVMPYIESHYSTYAGADHRGVFGYSMGGGATLFLGTEYLDTFRHLGPFSAAPSGSWPNNGAEAKQKMKSMVLACGDQDWIGLFGPNLDLHNCNRTNRNKKSNIAKIHLMLGKAGTVKTDEKSVEQLMLKLTGVDITLCSCCKKGKMKIVSQIPEKTGLCPANIIRPIVWRETG